MSHGLVAQSAAREENGDAREGEGRRADVGTAGRSQWIPRPPQGATFAAVGAMRARFRLDGEPPPEYYEFVGTLIAQFGG